MQIFNHFIKDSEIIGIGPLKIKYLNDATSPFYQPAYFFFTVYLKTRDVEIETDTFEKAPRSDEEKNISQKTWDECWAFYDYARKNIEVLIREEKLVKPRKRTVKRKIKTPL